MKQNYLLIGGLCAFFASAGLLGGAAFKTLGARVVAADTPASTADAVAQTGMSDAVINELIENNALVTPDTVFLFDTIFSGDDVIERAEEPAFDHLIGRSEEEVARAFPDWQIAFFSADTVVLQRVVEGLSGQVFLVTEFDGFVAVYYENTGAEPLLKQITETPVASLPFDQLERVKEGIAIRGSDELYRVLQDLGS